MIESHAYLYAVLIVMATIWSIWIGNNVDEIRKELKSIRERMDKK
jgi:hypothetical protein